MIDEDEFMTWWTDHGQVYEDAAIANGDTPWPRNERKLEALRQAGFSVAGTDIEKRRQLFMRRYTRPSPPDGLFIDPRRSEQVRLGSAEDDPSPSERTAA